MLTVYWKRDFFTQGDCLKLTHESGDFFATVTARLKEEGPSIYPFFYNMTAEPIQNTGFLQQYQASQSQFHNITLLHLSFKDLWMIQKPSKSYQ